MKSALAVGICSLLALACADAAWARGVARIAPHQEIVALFGSRKVRDRAALHARVVAVIADRRPITGERTVLPVLAQTIDNHGRAWLRVRLPGRALGSQPPPPVGWINASSTLISSTPWHIVVELGARRVIVYRAGRRLRSFPAIVGKPSTPTPTGEYFVEENVRMPAGQPGAPFALATSDRSHVLQEFDGGPGQIALHGLENVGGQLGTAESHGCVRLADSDVTWLAARIAPGVPITIS
jgi:lipoprotein-anchoring transpeptidase ErfK/SrfK